MSTTTRRTFLKGAAAGATTVGLATTMRAAGANERINAALIGCGGRGGSFMDHVQYVCDPDQKRLASAAQKIGAGSDQAVSDMRKIFDNPEIQAVFIATPDHWHAPAAIMACEAGKHVYVEKPCSHNVRESRLLLDAARRNNVVVQHGTQQRSSSFMADAIQMLHEGIIGDVLVAKAWNIQRRGNIGHASPSQPPAEIDYDMWVGPAEFMPFQENRFHYSWHWWYNFGTGDLGNDGAHELDYARWGLGVDTLPSKVSGIGGKYYFDDDQQFPDTATCVFEYPGDGSVGNRRQLIFEMRIWSKNYPYNTDSGAEFYGTQGKMFVSKRGKLQILNDQNQRIEPQERKGSRSRSHVEDFFDAIRNGRRPNADILEAHRSVTPIHLGNLAVRLGRSFEFDPKKEEITGDDEANRMLSRTYRKEGHWAIPRVSPA